jgi:hypothetical protein
VAVPDGSLFNRQIGQPTLTIMAGEADGVVPQLDPLAHLFGVSGSSGGDFDSLTHKPGSPKLAASILAWISLTKRCGDGCQSSGRYSPRNFAADARAQYRGAISTRWP